MAKLNVAANAPSLTVTPDWNGSPLPMQQNDNATMQQTPAGSAILAMLDQSSGNAGTIQYAAGGGTPTTVPLDAGATAPTIVTNNFDGNALTITNTSQDSDTTIMVQLIGPGIPGVTPVSLPLSSQVSLSAGAVAQGSTKPEFMELVISTTSTTFGVVGIIGGKVLADGSNAYVITINDSVDGNTGPGTGNNPPAGYYATTINSSYTFNFNFNGDSIFVGNMSASTATDIDVTLTVV